MSPLSAPVLGGAALLSSPALLGMVENTTSPVVALSRFLICVGVLWVGFGFLEMLVGPSQPARLDQPTDDPNHPDSSAG